MNHCFYHVKNFQRSEDDVSQFDTKFTKQIPVDSPEDSMLSESANMMFQVIELKHNCLNFLIISFIIIKGFTYVAPGILEEMNQTRVVTARSPRRNPRGRDEQMLRVFPGASSSVADISNQPQFYPNSSQFQNNNRHNHIIKNFRQSPHLQGFANTPTNDDVNMEDPNAHQNV